MSRLIETFSWELCLRCDVQEDCAMGQFVSQMMIRAEEPIGDVNRDYGLQADISDAATDPDRTTWDALRARRAEDEEKARRAYFETGDLINQTMPEVINAVVTPVSILARKSRRDEVDEIREGFSRKSPIPGMESAMTFTASRFIRAGAAAVQHHNDEDCLQVFIDEE